VYRKDPKTGRFANVYTKAQLETWAATIPSWMGDGLDAYFIFNKLHFIANAHLGGTPPPFMDEEPFVLAVVKGWMAQPYVHPDPQTQAFLREMAQSYTWGLIGLAPFGSEGFWYQMRSHVGFYRPLARGAVHLNTILGKLKGFLAYADTTRAKWMLMTEKVESEQLREQILSYIRLWRDPPGATGFDESMDAFRAQIMKMSQTEGIYGYFTNDETKGVRWVKTKAKSKAELERMTGYLLELEAEALREDAEEQYGLKVQVKENAVEISAPALFDVFRVGKLSSHFGVNEKEAKRAMYQHIKESPIPARFQKLQRIATQTDNIEDYVSTALGAGWVISKIMARYAPGIAARVGERAVPILGWAMIAQDLLNFATSIFNLGSNPLMVKRTLHGAKALGPKGALMRLKNTERLKNWKPTWGTILEALQASENATGYGLRLGAIMGCLSEEFWAAEKFLTGETDKVKVSYPWQRPGTAEYAAYKAMGSSCELLPTLYFTNPYLYMMIVLSFSYAAEQGVKKSFHPEWDKVYGEIKDMTLIERPPTNPITREVLKEMGYDPDEKVGYLGIDGPYMPKVSELGMLFERDPGVDLEEKFLQMKDSWHAYAWRCALYDLDVNCINMLAWPDSGVEYHNWSDMDVLIEAAKMSIIPPLNTPVDQVSMFCQLIKTETGRLGAWPQKSYLEQVARMCWGDFDIQCPPVKVWKPH